MKTLFNLALTLCLFLSATAQNNTTYWQQHVDYNMTINVDEKNNQYTGKQTLVYTNNSPDVLEKVFYHPGLACAALCTQSHLALV